MTPRRVAIAIAAVVLATCAPWSTADAAPSVGDPLPFVWPVTGRTAAHSSGHLGACRDGCRRRHEGLDIKTDWSSYPVVAARSGVVREVGGNCTSITIDHPGGYVTRYLHLGSYAPGLAVGDQVRQGQVIATGYTHNCGSTGPHLHFEINGGPRSTFFHDAHVTDDRHVGNLNVNGFDVWDAAFRNEPNTSPTVRGQPIPVDFVDGERSIACDVDEHGALAPAGAGTTRDPCPLLPTTLVRAAYADLLGRPADAVGLQGWVGVLASGSPRFVVIQGINRSAEGTRATVSALYRSLLARGPDPVGLTGWSSAVRSGLTTTDVAVAMLSSSELRGWAGSDAAWIDAIYQRMLGRAADPAGIRAWSAAHLQYGPATVALGIYQSPEARNRRARQLVEHVLGRPADDADLRTWSVALVSLDDGAVVESLAASEEYARRSLERFGQTAPPVAPVTADPASDDETP